LEPLFLGWFFYGPLETKFYGLQGKWKKVSREFIATGAETTTALRHVSLAHIEARQKRILNLTQAQVFPTLAQVFRLSGSLVFTSL
jgi:hypothetical protein